MCVRVKMTYEVSCYLSSQIHKWFIAVQAGMCRDDCKGLTQHDALCFHHFIELNGKEIGDSIALADCFFLYIICIILSFLNFSFFRGQGLWEGYVHCCRNVQPFLLLNGRCWESCMWDACYVSIHHMCIRILLLKNQWMECCQRNKLATIYA